MLEGLISADLNIHTHDATSFRHTEELTKRKTKESVEENRSETKIKAIPVDNVLVVDRMLNSVFTWKVERSPSHGRRGNLSMQKRVTHAEKRMRLWMRLAPSFVVPSQPSTTAPFPFVKLFQEMESA